MTAYVQIEYDSTNTGKVFKTLQDLDPEFPWPSPWWRGAPVNARGWTARTLSHHDCSGRLSVVRHEEGTCWDQAPKPVWTGFSPRGST